MGLNSRIRNDGLVILLCGNERRIFYQSKVCEALREMTINKHYSMFDLRGERYFLPGGDDSAISTSIVTTIEPELAFTSVNTWLQVSDPKFQYELRQTANRVSRCTLFRAIGGT